MLPVSCWERTWVPLPGATHVKILKWVKVDKLQQFNDDDGNVDEPLAPLLDDQEGEVIEVEGDVDEEGMAIDTEAGGDNAAAAAKILDSNVASTIASQTRDASEAAPDSSKAPSPVLKPHGLTMSLQLDEYNDDDNEDTLDTGASGMEESEAAAVPSGSGLSVEILPDEDLAEQQGLPLDANIELPHTSLDMEDDGAMSIDMAAIGPDGIPFGGEGEQPDLSQLESADALLGGTMMDQSLDPFNAGNLEAQ